MKQVKRSGPTGEAMDSYDRNAQRGQNRAGIDLEDGVSFDEYESSQKVNPSAADDRIADEGPEIQARVHALGHDVVGTPDDDE